MDIEQTKKAKILTNEEIENLLKMQKLKIITKGTKTNIFRQKKVLFDKNEF